MKRLLILLLLIGIAGCGSDAQKAQEENTPAGLFKKIYALAQEEDYEKLQECIFPHSEQDLPDMMLQGIKEQKGRGDAAYSHKALKFLIDNHLDKLKPAAGAFLESCMPDGDFGGDERIAKIAKTRPQDITMFDFEQVHILIIKLEGEHKLVFWERLPILSGEYSLDKNPQKSESGEASGRSTEQPPAEPDPAPSVKELTLREKVIGTYELELKKFGETQRYVLLDNSTVEYYLNGKKEEAEHKWSIVDKEVHIERENRAVSVFSINKDESITGIATIDEDGKRKEILKEHQYTRKKIN